MTTASDNTASGFYISNSYNRVKGNAAVGGFAGYHFPVFDTPIGLHRDVAMVPRDKPTLEFDGNSCRSSGWWWGNAGCLYAGGLFAYVNDDDHELDDAEGGAGVMLYNPGRGTMLGTCAVDTAAYGGSCPWYAATDVRTEDRPVGCKTWQRFTNFKASLCNIGLMHWGARAQIEKFEAHDIIGGPATQLFGEASVRHVTSISTIRDCNP